MREEETFTNKTLKGIGVSSGITSGRVYLLEREGLSLPSGRSEKKTLIKRL